MSGPSIFICVQWLSEVVPACKGGARGMAAGMRGQRPPVQGVAE